MGVHNKGFVSSIENPGVSAKVKWIRDIALKWEGDDCLIFPFSRNPTGYARMWYGGRQIYAHQLVCTLVNGPRPSPNHDAAHSCGNGHLACVSRHHLSWKTKSENQHEGWANRTQRYKLTPEQVAEIKANTEAPHVVAERYGINERAVRKIRAGEGWKIGTYAFAGKPTKRAKIIL